MASYSYLCYSFYINPAFLKNNKLIYNFLKAFIKSSGSFILIFSIASYDFLSAFIPAFPHNQMVRYTNKDLQKPTKLISDFFLHGQKYS